jgi:AmiR/NasT family two-component response regulator
VTGCSSRTTSSSARCSPHRRRCPSPNAQLYDSACRLTQQLQEALTSRAMIDQAKGIIMSQSGVGAEEAFGMLRSASQRENRKLRDLAQETVDRARRD